MSRGAKVAAALVVVVAAAGGGVALAIHRDTDHDAAAEAETATELSTVTVARRDLVTYDETSATLGFTASATVSAPVAGTVTSIVASGAEIDPGSVVATIDGAPVVALIGDVPGYRDLDIDSDDGPDIRQLETNLVQLGFDPDGAIEIDETFDDATEDAVTAWEDSLGLEGDGEVPQGEIVYVPGRLLVDTVNATVGAAVDSSSALLTARLAERSFLVPATVGESGTGTTVDRIADDGTAVTTGTVLFWDAGIPVVALLGDTAATPALARDLSLGVDDGSDVKLLEQLLTAVGADPDGAMTIDDAYDEATAAAVVRWLTDLGAAPTTDDPVVPAGSIVVVPDGLFVGTPALADGASITSDQVVLSLTAAARVVTTSAPIGDETFALGAEIEVEFPDGTLGTGTVVGVGDVATSSGVPGDTPTVEIDIQVDDIPATVDGFVEVPVTLRVVAESALDAYVVPVSALVALAEGGYALEVVTGEAATTTGGTAGSAPTTLIAVETGLFADGFVAVTGDQLRDDLEVVVPS